MHLIANTIKRFRIALILPTFLLLSSFLLLEGDNELTFGEKVPLTDKQLINIDNTSVSLNDLKQENGLIIIFSCNTCPFVIGNEDFEGWEKQYNDLYTKAIEKGIGLVLINSNEAKREGDDSFDEMKIHAKKAGYKMPYLVDVNSTMANVFGAKTTPHVFLLNAKMELVYMGSIDNIWDKQRKEDIPYLEDALQQLAAQKKIKTDSSAPKGCSIKRITN